MKIYRWYKKQKRDKFHRGFLVDIVLNDVTKRIEILRDESFMLIVHTKHHYFKLGAVVNIRKVGGG